jgi:hypothetical protein
MRRRSSNLLYSAVVLASLLAFGLQAAAQTADNTTLLARLSGASLVPPTDSTAKGDMQATLDKRTRVLRWTLTTQGLSGAPVGASLHGPAMPGENAAVAVPLATGPALDSGSVTLTPMQIDELLAERWYVAVATAASPHGEIRGQLMVGRR